MPEALIYATKSALIKKDQPNQNFHTASSEDITFFYEDSGTAKELLVGFGNYDAYKYKKLLGAEFRAYTTFSRNSAVVAPYLTFSSLVDTFNESTVTFNNAPDRYALTDKFAISRNDSKTAYLEYSRAEVPTGNNYVSMNRGTSEFSYPLVLKRLAESLRNGLVISEYVTREQPDRFDNTFSLLVQTSRGANKPAIRITYADQAAEPELKGFSPATGYIPKNTACRFSWGAVEKDFSIAKIEQTSATFYYRNSTSGTYSSRSVSGSSEYCDLPASYITGNTFQWYVATNYNTGATITSEVFTLSTVESTSEARIVSPKNTLIDARVENVFSWEHIISTGTAPTGAVAQYSTNGTTWVNLPVTLATDKLSGTVSANFFSAGQYYWRVATKNTDGTTGTYSDPATFVVISAPSVPSLSVNTASGKPIVSWQSSDQQGWQLIVDNSFDTGAQYGTANRYTLPYYLTAGQHTFMLRVVNKYGLWSEYATAIVNAQTTGSAITLTASNSNSGINLTWNVASSSYYSGGFYIVLRDDVPIAKMEYSPSPSYVDTLAAGKHTYKILGVKNADYAYSNEVTETYESEVFKIADVDTLAWKDLIYSTSTFSDKRYSSSITNVLRHITAEDYPVIEISRYRTKSCSFNTAFKNELEAEEFENLFGKIVAVKYGREFLIGALTSISKTKSLFYVAYSCTINQIAFNEAIEI